MSYGPAYDYSLSKGQTAKASHFKAEYDRRMQELLDFIANRDNESDKVIRNKSISFR